MSETTLRSLRLAMASLLSVALVARLAIGMSRSDLSPVDFLSSFTVLSNIGAVVMLSWMAWRPDRSSSTGFVSYRGAVTVYMSVTGLVYVALLASSGPGVAPSEPWVTWSLYVVGPLAVVIDWLFHTPAVKLAHHAVLLWLVFPSVYLAYILTRGAVVGSYPYPFLDPRESTGYGGVALWSAVVLALIVGFGYAYHWWATRRTGPPATA